MKTLVSRGVLVLALLGSTLCSVASAGSITIKGSDTLVILAQKWAETYMSKHPETKIQVTGGGSGIGFAALQNKTTDIADASRPIKAKELEACIKAFGRRAAEYKVAVDGLSVYVNNDNPVKELSLEQLEGIFTGRISCSYAEPTVAVSKPKYLYGCSHCWCCAS